MVVWGGLTNSWEKKRSKEKKKKERKEKRREGKGEKERYINLNAAFQRITRWDKKAFLGDQYKEIEEKNRMSKLDSLLKSRDITLPTKVCIVKAMEFPVVMYGCESWTMKKAEHWRTDGFELWYGEDSWESLGPQEGQASPS